MNTVILILWILTSLSSIVLSYTTYNLMRKNEKMEDFIESQSEFIKVMDDKLKEIDNRGSFNSDDEIGWFFTSIKTLQKGLNEFRLD